MQHDEIKGFTDQTEKNKANVNANKETEERIYRTLTRLTEEGYDKRYLDWAEQCFMTGFMYMNRAIFQPSRIALPEDTATEEHPMPPVYVGEVFQHFDPDKRTSNMYDRAGNKLIAVGPHYYDANAYEDRLKKIAGDTSPSAPAPKLAEVLGLTEPDAPQLDLRPGAVNYAEAPTTVASASQPVEETTSSSD